MWRKDLFIDTRFSEIDSTDVKQNQGEFESGENQPMEWRKDQAILNFMVLDFYYRGVVIIDSIFDTTQEMYKKEAFRMIRALENNRGNRTGSFRKKEPEGNFLSGSKAQSQQVENRGREHSDSVDRIKLLNNIADRILETKRVKSESKNSSKTHISLREGKKILSKLDKLEKIIKNIRKENQLSNQASVVYINRARYPEEQYAHDRYGTNVPVEIDYSSRPPTYNPSRSQRPIYTPHRNPYTSYQSPRDRYYGQSSVHMNNPHRYPEESHIYRGYEDQYQPTHTRNPRQDESVVHHRNISQRLKHFPTRQYQDQQEEQSDSVIEHQRNNVNQQILNIKEQLDQLKKMNMQYITKNTLLEEEVRHKHDKKYTYQNQLPQRGQPRRVDSEYIRATSVPKLQVNNTKHPLVPSLDLKRTNPFQVSRRVGQCHGQKHSHPSGFYTNRSYHPYQTNAEYGGYPIPQVQTDRGFGLEHYTTPSNIKHNIRQPSNNICGQCGCRCHDHEHTPYKGHHGF